MHVIVVEKRSFDPRWGRPGAVRMALGRRSGGGLINPRAELVQPNAAK